MVLTRVINKAVTVSKSRLHDIADMSRNCACLIECCRWGIFLHIHPPCRHCRAPAAMHVQHWPTTTIMIWMGSFDSIYIPCTMLLLPPQVRMTGTCLPQPKPATRTAGIIVLLNVVTADEHPAFSCSKSHQTTVLARLKIGGCATTVTYRPSGCARHPRSANTPPSSAVHLPLQAVNTASSRPSPPDFWHLQPDRVAHHSHWTTASAMLARPHKQQSSTPSMSRPRSTSSHT